MGGRTRVEVAGCCRVLLANGSGTGRVDVPTHGRVDVAVHGRVVVPGNGGRAGVDVPAPGRGHAAVFVA